MGKPVIDPYTLEAVYTDGSRVPGAEYHARKATFKFVFEPLAKSFALMRKQGYVFERWPMTDDARTKAEYEEYKQYMETVS